MSDKYTRIRTDETLRETVHHGSNDYPFRYYYEDIWDFDLHCIDWHWHPEVEFVYIQKGTADFLIGSGRTRLSAGTGIFINSKMIHRFESPESTIIPNIVFSPALLAREDSLVYKKYILPVTESSTECIIFTPDVPWKRNVIGKLLSVFDVQENRGGNELKTTSLLMDIWENICENSKITQGSGRTDQSSRIQAQLRIMMEYIHSNHKEKLTLDDIARTVMMSKSSVLKMFSAYIHISPIEYLINYRLRRAAELLTGTENSIAAVAQETGFDNTGYFCRRFKSLYGLTPGEYRKTSKGAISCHSIS